MSTQEPQDNTNGGEQQLYDTVQENTKMDRRSLMRRTAAAGAIAAGGTAATERYAPQYSPVGGAEAIAPIVGYGVAVAAGAGAKMAYDYFTADADDMSKSQLHRTLRSISRGMDSADSEESELENLVAERSSNWIWQDAVLQFEKGFNDTSSDAPGIEDLKLEMEQSILSDYSDIEQTIIDNQTTEIIQMLEMWNAIDSYGYKGSIGDMMEFEYNTFSTDWGWTSATPGDGVDNYDNITSSDDLLRPFSDFYESAPTVYDMETEVDEIQENQNYDGINDVDELVKIDYERLDGETFPAVVGWGNVSMYHPDEWSADGTVVPSYHYYDGVDGITDIHVSADAGDASGNVLAWSVKDPDDGSRYKFLDSERRCGAIKTIRSEAKSLAGEVSSWVDTIADNYTRGNLPKSDVVSTSRLWEEYQYEEGNPSMTALAASQLGYETDLKGTVTLTDYGTISYSDGDELPDDGDVYDGHLIFDVPEDGNTPSVDSGKVYDSRDWSNITVGITQPSGNTHELEGVFRIDKIRSYEDGETVEKDSYTPSSYTFSPRDPNRYEEDVDEANDAREDATENPNINLNLGGGGGILPSADSLPAWLWLIPGGGLVLGVLYAFIKISGD